LFDIATPGSLPIFQKATLIPALRAAIALGCRIRKTSRFDRKHYFYHDQPAGYQLTQYYEPFATYGSVTLNRHDGIGPMDGPTVTVGIKQVQMEQDTAKSQELDAETTLIDFNRAGQALVEIISLPQIHSPETAAAYVRKVQAILLSVNAVTNGMEAGGLRADVNVSVRRRNGPPGTNQYDGIGGLGQRTEIKNLSTFKGVEAAIKAERDRQIGLLEAGGIVQGETRGWSLAAPTVTRRLRGKEGEIDYRYMPDADIPPIIIGSDLVEYLRKNLPQLPDELITILTEDERYGLSITDAKILLQLDDGQRLDYYISAVKHLNVIWKDLGLEKDVVSPGQLAGNWVMHEMGSLLTTTGKSWKDNQVPSYKLAWILVHLMSGRITGTSAKQILKMVFNGDEREVGAIIQEDGLVYRTLSEDEYNQLATRVMMEHTHEVQQIRDKGQTGKLMFLVGQMMRAGEEGRVEAKKAELLLRQLILDEPSV
jgi:aspartyl-tRNA(Asn)/glutamyl-tRNA(Gln) amidotransferase subunit B